MRFFSDSIWLSSESKFVLAGFATGACFLEGFSAGFSTDSSAGFAALFLPLRLRRASSTACFLATSFATAAARERAAASSASRFTRSCSLAIWFSRFSKGFVSGATLRGLVSCFVSSSSFSDLAAPVRPARSASRAARSFSTASRRARSSSASRSRASISSLVSGRSVGSPVFSSTDASPRASRTFATFSSVSTLAWLLAGIPSSITFSSISLLESPYSFASCNTRMLAIFSPYCIRLACAAANCAAMPSASSFSIPHFKARCSFRVFNACSKHACEHT